VVLRTTYIKIVNFKIIKTKTGCQYVGYFYYSKNINELDITVLVHHLSRQTAFSFLLVAEMFECFIGIDNAT